MRQDKRGKRVEVKKTFAIAAICSDSRLRRAAGEIDRQLREIFPVEEVIPLPRPGLVGLYADPQVLDRPLRAADLVGFSDIGIADVRRIAFESEVSAHVDLHAPRTIVMASHHDCLGHPGCDEHQRWSAISAADILRRRLGRIGIEIPVRPTFFAWSPNPGWKVELLDLPKTN